MSVLHKTFRDAGITKSFLEQVYPQFQILRMPRRLEVAFHYYVISNGGEGGLPIEMELVTTFVLLENP